jgi:hypothetical protein
MPAPGLIPEVLDLTISDNCQTIVYSTCTAESAIHSYPTHDIDYTCDASGYRPSTALRSVWWPDMAGFENVQPGLGLLQGRRLLFAMSETILEKLRRGYRIMSLRLE